MRTNPLLLPCLVVASLLLATPAEAAEAGSVAERVPSRMHLGVGVGPAISGDFLAGEGAAGTPLYASLQLGYGDPAFSVILTPSFAAMTKTSRLRVGFEWNLGEGPLRLNTLVDYGVSLRPAGPVAFSLGSRVGGVYRLQKDTEALFGVQADADLHASDQMTFGVVFGLRYWL